MYSCMHVICIRTLNLVHFKVLYVVRFMTTCSSNNVTPKLHVGTGKTGYNRTRNHSTHTRPDKRLPDPRARVRYGQTRGYRYTRRPLFSGDLHKFVKQIVSV